MCVCVCVCVCVHVCVRACVCVYTYVPWLYWSVIYKMRHKKPSGYFRSRALFFVRFQNNSGNTGSPVLAKFMVYYYSKVWLNMFDCSNNREAWWASCCLLGCDWSGSCFVGFFYLQVTCARKRHNYTFLSKLNIECLLWGRVSHRCSPAHKWYSITSHGNLSILA